MSGIAPLDRDLYKTLISLVQHRGRLLRKRDTQVAGLLKKFLSFKSDSSDRYTFTQGLYLLTGIFISAGLFLALHFYVSKIYDYSRKANITAVETALKKDFTFLESEFLRISSGVQNYYAASGQTNLQVLRMYSPDVKKGVEGLFIVDADRFLTQRRLSPVVLTKDISPSLLKNYYLNDNNIKSLYDLYRPLIEGGFTREDYGPKILDFNFKTVPSLSADWTTEEMPVAIAQLFRSRSGNVFLIAVIKPKAMIQDLEFKDVADIHNLDISFADGGRFFNIQKVKDSEENSDPTKTHSFNISFFNTPLVIDIKFRVSEERKVLAFLPYIASLLAFLLTLLALAMRRAVQKRSEDMLSLNKDLTNKNYEISMEMRKRERLNMAVRKSERENRAIINAVSDVIFEIDINGVIQFINETWTRLTGYSVEDSIDKRLVEFFSDEDHVEQAENLLLLAQGKKAAYSAIVNLITAEGKKRPAQMRISMLRQDESKNLRVVGTLTDLEEKRKAEEAILQAEENYKRIWENAANGIYEIDINGKIISANPAMADILGYDDPEEMMRAISNVHKEIYVTPEEKEKYLANALEKSELQRFEIGAKKKGGELIWINESFNAMRDENGNFTHFEGTIDDITERKNADIALKKAKLESDMANRAKSDFLANMSHELRTPLNSIIGFAEIIKNQVMGEIKQDSYIEYAGEIHDSGRGLLMIINQILDVSKIEGGDRSLNESLVNMSKCASICIDLMATKIADKQLEVTNEIPADIVDIIAEDRSVRQMMYNLFSNAVKFTPNGGSVTLKSAFDENDNLLISIVDTGVGLSEEELKRATQPFDIMEGDHSRDKYGMGLGLTLVKMLIELHDGELRLESEKDKGTTATLLFPKERVRMSNKSKSGSDRPQSAQDEQGEQENEEIRQDKSYQEADIFAPPKSLQ